MIGTYINTYININNLLIIYSLHLRPLQSVLHSAARLILRIRKYDRISAAIREETPLAPGASQDPVQDACLGAQMPTWTRTFVLD